jgi:SAM-dependent methyltransferase
MSWRQSLFNFLYRIGRPIWDIDTPSEVRNVIEGEAALPIGRALDAGCGTGTMVIYLAQHGWEAIGVDFSANAIQQAKRKANGIAGATFVEGDVTKLREEGIQGPFDLVLDNGCFHALPPESRPAYVQEVAGVTRSGALMMMWEVSEQMLGIPRRIKVPVNQITDLFGKDFVMERVEEKDFIVERMKRRFQMKANWYWLRRK